MSDTFRNFINAGYSNGEPRLVTAQGTYGLILLECFDGDMKKLWQTYIPENSRGPKGSHMFPICDIDGDGKDEIFYGERCIDIDTGMAKWIGGKGDWFGHSDIIAPVMDRQTGKWSLYTCRESLPITNDDARVVMFDAAGEIVWKVSEGLGHMDMGWAARLGDNGEHFFYALDIETKVAGPDGFKRGGIVEYLFDSQGQKQEVTFPLYASLPVDFNGDGLHELMYYAGDMCGQIADRHGNVRWKVDGQPRHGGKFLDLPGEQIVTNDTDGTVRIYACPGAEDSPAALDRYAHPYYPQCLKARTQGANAGMSGGL